jgi:hypothetical protein
MAAVMFQIALTGLVVVVFARRLGQWRWRRRGGPPGCGHCGYPATGLAKLVCPECGADLTRVGILTRRSVRPVGRVYAFALWTVAALALGAAVGNLVGLELPRPHRQTQTVLLTPNSGRFGNVMVELVGVPEGRVARYERARLIRSGPGAPAPLEVDLAALIGASPWHTGGGRDGGAVTVGELSRWLGGADEEALDLYQRLVHWAALGAPGDGDEMTVGSDGAYGNVRITRRQTMIAGPWAMILAAGALWIAGLFTTDRLARRREERFRGRRGADP